MRIDQLQPGRHRAFAEQPFAGTENEREDKEGEFVDEVVRKQRLDELAAAPNEQVRSVPCSRRATSAATLPRIGTEFFQVNGSLDEVASPMQIEARSFGCSWWYGCVSAKGHFNVVGHLKDERRRDEPTAIRDSFCESRAVRPDEMATGVTSDTPVLFAAVDPPYGLGGGNGPY